MTELGLTGEQTESAGNKAHVAFVLRQGDEEMLRRDVLVFSEDDMIRVSNEVTEVGNLNQADVDQMMASLIEPIRMQVLRDQERVSEENQVQDAPVAPPRYVAVLPGTEGNESGESGIRDLLNDRLLANFVLMLNEDIEVQDDIEAWREFAGRLTTVGRTVPFRIRAKDFADNGKLKAALFEAGGCELIVHCGMDELRKAISTISSQNEQVRQRKLTTNFGWTAGCTTYLTPHLRISAAGMETLDDKAEMRVDLQSEMPACNLDLKKLSGDELVRVKRHVVEDLLALSDLTVTHTLLGATAAAVLYPFAKGAGRFALWLVGRTGAGKSYLAKLFSNFFGDFPIASGRFTTWSATANFVQRQGYYFKDAVYLVDDYKPEVVQPYQVLRVLQTYADSTARGRLKADATANVLRPIRGLLLCTGEDVPEHNASAIGRSVILHVPQQGKNLQAGSRCVHDCEHYAGVMADFIRWLLAEQKLAVFAVRFAELQKRYYRDVAGQQNDIRIAANLAQLGAAFELFAEYLADVWPDWREAARRFVEEELVVVRGNMLGEAKEQQASEVFLRTLADLILFNHVRIDRLTTQLDADHKPLVGRVADPRPVPGMRLASASTASSLEISTSLALAEVNACLRQQGRAELKITESALLQQLMEDGKLLDRNGERLSPSADLTHRVRMNGNKQVRVFAISRSELLGE